MAETYKAVLDVKDILIFDMTQDRPQVQNWEKLKQEIKSHLQVRWNLSDKNIQLPEDTRVFVKGIVPPPEEGLQLHLTEEGKVLGIMKHPDN